MLPIVKAFLPEIVKLSHENMQWLQEQEDASTLLKKASIASTKKEVSERLVVEVIKVGSMLLDSLKSNNLKNSLKKYGPSKEEDEVKPVTKESQSISPMRALGYGAMAAVPLGLTANYAINKASDEMDSKMYAIPGLAAATVGAILAMRNKHKIDDLEKAKELQDALLAKEVIGTAEEQKVGSYSKLAHINSEHIANIISDLLVR